MRRRFISFLYVNVLRRRIYRRKLATRYSSLPHHFESESESMDEEFDSGTPARGRDNKRRSVSTSRVTTRMSSDLDEPTKRQLRSELNLNREFIDFDVIKGYLLLLATLL